MTDSVDKTKAIVDRSVQDFERLSEELSEYGLTPNETKVFIQLLKLGPITASEIGRSLGISRTEVYNILTSLQNKGIIEASLDRPAKFSAVGFEKALDILIDAERKKVMTMEKNKETLMEIWKNIQVPSVLEEREKLQLLKGVEQIYARISDMLNEAKEEVNIVAFGADLIRAYNAGVLHKLRDLNRRNVRVQILTHGISRTSNIISYLKKYAEIMEVAATGLSTPYFVIVDNKQLLLFTKPPGSSRMERKEATALWTNSSALVQSLKKLFNGMIQPEGIVVRPLSIEQEMKRSEEDRIAFRKQLVDTINMIGLKAEENFKITGNSGITHEFDIGVFTGDDKPIVCDIIFDISNITVAPVVRFYTKKNDVVDMIKDSTLIVRPKLTRDARELADFYKIRVVELQPQSGG
ncbi:MAG: helix-turn-helix domain-containing protein [Thermoproteota archaeon]|nr:TrmB family transcriptional regulator [Candidatus Brockarchaeota archaeon]